MIYKLLEKLPPFGRLFLAPAEARATAFSCNSGALWAYFCVFLQIFFFLVEKKIGTKLLFWQKKILPVKNSVDKKNSGEEKTF